VCACARRASACVVAVAAVAGSCRLLQGLPGQSSYLPTREGGDAHTPTYLYHMHACMQARGAHAIMMMACVHYDRYMSACMHAQHLCTHVRMQTHVGPEKVAGAGCKHIWCISPTCGARSPSAPLGAHWG
jgi:hypothetical protein